MPLLTPAGHIKDSASVMIKARSQPNWTKSGLEANPHWKIMLPDSILSSVLVLNHWLVARGHTWNSSETRGLRIQNLNLLAQMIRYHLTQTTGVVLLSGFNVEDHGEAAGRLLQLQLGYALGSVLNPHRPLHDLCSPDYAQGHGFLPRTFESSGYHTDSTETDLIPGVVSLFCLHTAREGGHHRLANTLTAYQRLFQSQPEVLRRLCLNFTQDSVDEHASLSHHDRLRNAFPVFEWGRWYPGLTCRYRRHWIEANHDQARFSLSEVDLFALKQFEATLNQADLTYELQLQPGDMLFLNNHLIARDRMGYRDWDEPEKKRHLIRMWIGNDALQDSAPKPGDL